MSSQVATALGQQIRCASVFVLLVSRVSASAGLRLAWERAMRHVERWETQRDGDSVAFAKHGPNADAIFARASEFAHAGREDGGAVDELRKVADGDRAAVEEAERLSRVGASHLEDLVLNRRQRLLAALLTDSDVGLLTPDDEGRCAAVAEFQALEPEARWERLVDLEPRLAALAHGTRGGDRANSGERDTTTGRRRATEKARRWFALNEQVGALLGPNSGHTDLLLSSRAARNTAVHRLQEPRKHS